METGNLSKKEFRDLLGIHSNDSEDDPRSRRKRMVAQSEKIQEILNKELDDIKKKKQSVEQLNNENEKYTLKE